MEFSPKFNKENLNFFQKEKKNNENKTFLGKGHQQKLNEIVQG